MLSDDQLLEEFNSAAYETIVGYDNKNTPQLQNALTRLNNVRADYLCRLARLQNKKEGLVKNG